MGRTSKQVSVFFESNDSETEEQSLNVTAGSFGVIVDINNGYLFGSKNYKEVFYWDTMTKAEAQALIDTLQFFIDESDED